MYMGEHKQIALVRLFTLNNGGTIGDAWGEFVTPGDFPSSTKWFTSG